MRYEFLSHCLDAQRRELRRQGTPVSLARKPFAVLLYLIENRNRMVPKAELLDAFWPLQVSESVLQTTIRQIRRAVGDDGRSQRVIQTHHGEGFRFVASVSVSTIAPAEAVDWSLRRSGEEAFHAAGPGLAEPALPRPHEAVAACFDEHRLSAVLACRLACEGLDAARARYDPVDTFLGDATRLAEVHGGLMLHVMPDGFTAVFGAAVGVERGTVRAYEFARDLALSAAAQDMEQATGAPRFGIAAGHFPVVAKPSEARVRALTLPVLKSASALAKAATRGHAALSERAASHLGAELRARQTATGELPLRRAPPALVDGGPSTGLSFEDFVGRCAELAFLSDSLERALRRQGAMAVLAGEAGIGKSRLLAEFLGHAGRRGCRCLKLLSDPRERNTPLATIAALARKIDAALGPSASDADPLEDVDRALWEELLGHTVDAAALAALTPHMRRQRTFRAIRTRVGQLAARGPMVLAIEDVHWLDATSSDCLHYLGQTLEGLAALLVVTTRLGTGPVPAAAPAVTTLRLPPLEQPDGLRLLLARLGPDRLRRDDADALVDRAGGNPFFLEQLLVAVEGGADPRHGLPDTVQEVIAVRIGRLSPKARALLLATAVIGPEAKAGMMASATGWAGTEFETALSELLAAGVLVEDPLEPPRSFRFRHILLQNVAYAMLATHDLRDLHRRIAQILTTAPATPAHPERLAWHHQEAGDHLAAVAHWTRAARAAQQRSASREAVTFARKGLRLLQPEASDRASIGRELELQLTIAPALAATLGYGSQEVGVAYRRARDLSRRAETPRSEFRMLVGLWNYDWVRGDLARAQGHAQELLGLAEQTGDPTLRLRAHACMGEILFHLGAIAPAARHLDAACRLFADSAEVRAATRVPAVACHCYAAWAASFLDRSDEALRLCGQAGDIASELLQPFSMALYLALKAELLLFEGEAAGCLDTARECCAISQREGFPFWHGTALVNLGWAQAQGGDPDRGLATLREGIAIFEATGARVQLANWYGLLAEVLHLAEDLAAARSAADIAADWARRTGDVFFLPRIERTRAALGRAS